MNLNKGTLIIDGPPLKNAKPAAKSALTAYGQLYFQQDNSTIFRHENAAFLQQVVSGKWNRNFSDYADGLKTLQLTLACDRAVLHGKATVAS